LTFKKAEIFRVVYNILFFPLGVIHSFYTGYHLLKPETEEGIYLGIYLKRRRCPIRLILLGIPLLVVINPIKGGIDVFCHGFTGNIK
jgi:hypothetical protein